MSAQIGSGQRVFIVAGRPDVPQVPVVCRAECSEIAARRGQAQVPIRSAAHPLGVIGVLPVVLPETHRADLIAASLVKSQVAAAWACVRATTLPKDVDERSLHGTNAATAAREVGR